MQKYSFFFGAFYLLLALAVVGLPISQADAAKVGTMMPPCGPPGTTFTATVAGYGAGEQIGYWVTDPQGQTFDPDQRLFADEGGQVVIAWVSPWDARGGDWTMQVRGFRGEREVLTLPFCIEAPETPPSKAPSFIIEPASHGPPGTTFTFVARGGFEPYEQVGSWFLLPDGSRLDVEQGISSDAQGQVYRVWTAPSDAIGGDWVLMNKGLNSSHEMAIPFTIDNPTNAPPTPTPSDPPSLTYRVEPERGPRGTTFTFEANGFKPGERVGTWAVRPDGSEVEQFPDEYVYADEQGSFRWTWTAPHDAPAGTWTMNIRGIQTRVEWSILFFIEGPDITPTPETQQTLGVSPEHAPAGSTFWFQATGFTPGERLFSWAIDPTGQPHETEVEPEVDRNGDATWSWTVEADKPIGQWSFAVRGSASWNEAQVSFSVVGAKQPDILVEPCCGRPGTTFSFYATGFYADEEMDYWLVGPDNIERRFDQEYDLVKNKISSSDAGGNVAWTWTAPEQTQGGTWHMVARGAESRIERVVAFDLVRDDPIPLPYSVSPASGPPGTTFTFTVENIPTDEAVYWLNAPDGRILPDDPAQYRHWRVPLGAEGQATWTWTSPPDAQPGQWTMVVYNAPSDFQIRPPKDEEDIPRYLDDFDKFEREIRRAAFNYREYVIPFVIE